MNGVETPQDKSDKVEEAESEKNGRTESKKMNNPDEGATGHFGNISMLCATVCSRHWL